MRGIIIVLLLGAIVYVAVAAVTDHTHASASDISLRELSGACGRLWDRIDATVKGLGSDSESPATYESPRPEPRERPARERAAERNASREPTPRLDRKWRSRVAAAAKERRVEEGAAVSDAPPAEEIRFGTGRARVGRKE